MIYVFIPKNTFIHIIKGQNIHVIIYVVSICLMISIYLRIFCLKLVVILKKIINIVFYLVNLWLFYYPCVNFIHESYKNNILLCHVWSKNIFNIINNIHILSLIILYRPGDSKWKSSFVKAYAYSKEKNF